MNTLTQTPSKFNARKVRGKFSRDDVLTALAETRITPANSLIVLDYLCTGTRIMDLGVSKQQATSRISKVLRVLTALNLEPQAD